MNWEKSEIHGMKDTKIYPKKILNGEYICL